MGYPRRLLTGDEEILRDFHPHWKMLVPSVVVLAVAAGLALLTWRVPPDGVAADRVITATVLGGGLLWFLAGFLRWRYTEYVLTTERLIVRSGVLARRGTEIPLEQITNVSFSTRLLERILRFGDLFIESAGTSGRSELHNIPDPEAFQSQIYRARDERQVHRQRGGGLSVVEQLERLEGLRARGVLTAEEFQAKKRRLLDS